MAKKRQENTPIEVAEKKPATTKKPAKKRANGELPWHPFWRWSASLLVVLHLTAVFSAPWDLMTVEALPPGFMPPVDAMGRLQPLPLDSKVWQTPVVTRSLHRFFHNYLNVLYLNHGYEFFAPDPAGTHVIDYKVTQADGQVVEGRLPSTGLQWPRLLYHRHMMLAEQTQMPVMGPQSGQQYADHLATVHGGTSHLELKVHLLLPPHRVADETPLDAPSTFHTIGTVEGRPRPQASPTPQQSSSQQSTSQRPSSQNGGQQ